LFVIINHLWYEIKIVDLGRRFDMKKSILLISLLMIIMTLGIGCGKDEIESDIDSKEELKLTTAFSVRSIPFFYMMENNTLGDNYNLTVEVHKTREEATTKILKNEANIAMLSVQEAANIYNKELPIKLINSAYGANFYLMTNNDSINEFEDLVDKKLWTSMKGGPVAFTLNQLLINNTKVDSEKDITYQFINLSELTQMVLNDLKDIEVFSLRDPFVSKIMLARDDIRIVKDFDQEWIKTFGSRIPLSSVVMGTDLLTKNDNIKDVFNEKYIEAITWVQENPEEAAQMGTKYLNGLSLEVIENAISNMNIEIINESSLEEELNFYFGQWLEFNPEMIGNKKPDSEFYK
jgi:NitT/TauT family transport system substrate-binding protein